MGQNASCCRPFTIFDEGVYDDISGGGKRAGKEYYSRVAAGIRGLQWPGCITPCRGIRGAAAGAGVGGTMVYLEAEVISCHASGGYAPSRLVRFW